MTAGEWARLKELFEAAIERPVGERDAWVSRVCENSAKMEEELRRLLVHAGDMGRFLDGGAGKTRRIFTPGERIAERFEILEFLGEGGMGEVYSASDSALGSTVALKTVRAEISSDTRNIERLRREIQFARQVTHRNVCRVFDLERHSSPSGPVLFLTMELVSGDTLAKRIACGDRFLESQTDSIIRQIAAALDAAHQAGIIHRDLKPANVMLSPDSGGPEPLRVVVMDFGLARQSSTVAAATRELFGTPAYMAPELLRGGDASVASDIYAFGTTIQELAGGEMNLGKWRRTVECCLAPLPEKRPSSAGLAVALTLGHARSHVLSRRTIFAAAGISAVSVSFGLFRLYSQNPSFPAGTVLLLSDIVNASEDPHLDAATEVYRSQLGQSAHLRLWDRARLSGVLRTMKLPAGQELRGTVAREVALREGVPFVLFGNVAPLAEGLNLDLRLEQLADGALRARNVWEFSIHVAGKDQLMEAIHKSCVWLRRTVGENSQELVTHDRLPQDTTTASWEALSLYAQAERARLRDAQDEAVSLLKQSVARDPHFALAHMRLGDLLLAMHQQGEGLRSWTTAVAEARGQNLTRREELRINGLYAAEVQDYPAAEVAFSQMEKEYPADYLPSFYAADALRWQGRFSEAVHKFEAAQQKNMTSVPVAGNLAGTLLMSGQFASIRPVLSRLEALGASDLAALYRGLLAFVQDDYPGSVRALKAAAASSNPDRRSRGHAALASVYAELGRYREARATLWDGVQADFGGDRQGSRADKLLMLAYLELRTRHPASLLSLCLEASDVENSPQRLTRGAVLLARAGYAAEASKLMKNLSRFPDCRLITVSVERIKGEIALVAGRVNAAVKCFEAVNALEPGIRLKDYLARAYSAAGDYEKAIPILDRIAGTPALIWETMELDYPGILTDSMFDLAEAASRLRDPDTWRRAVALYAHRRQGSDSGVPENIEGHGVFGADPAITDSNQ